MRIKKFELGVVGPNELRNSTASSKAISMVKYTHGTSSTIISFNNVGLLPGAGRVYHFLQVPITNSARARWGLFVKESLQFFEPNWNFTKLIN